MMEVDIFEAKCESRGQTPRVIFAFIVFMMTFVGVGAQNPNPLTWERFVEEIFSQDDESLDIGDRNHDELLEELQYIHDNPINLNTATADQLKVLPFLTEVQIKDILAYIENNAPMLSLGELMQIYSLDQQTRLRMMLFCYAGEMPRKDTDRLSIGKILRYSKNELTLRTDIPFYTKAGYQDYPDSILQRYPNRQYVGDRYYRSLRYSFSSLNHIDAGINLEKDAGEKDLDYISAYVYLRQLGKMKILALGDYKVSFGQGLVVNTSMGFGKTMMLSGLSNMDKGITKHSSMSEANHFRGAATTLMLKKNLILSAFASYTNDDGTLLNDSSVIITSFKTDGIHRTKGDRDKKGIIGNTTLGGNIRWETFSGKVRLGLTGIYTHLSKQLQPKCDTQSTLYKYYNAKGTDFSAYSASYSYSGRSIMFRGETALNSTGAPATVNSLQYLPNGNNKFILIQRFYSYRYSTLYGKSFGENSTPQNESGLFIGWNGTPIPKVKTDAYFDWFYFPYLKYQISDASQGWEAQAQVTYTPNATSTLSARYRIKSKQKDFKQTIDGKDFTSLAYYTNQSLRIQYSKEVNQHLSAKTTLSGTYNHKPSGEADKGFLLSQALRWVGNKKQKIDFTLAYFNTDSYDARVYGYESGLLYAYGMTSYYYHGLRALISGSVPLAQGLTLRAKLATTKYFDRDAIGTSQETIEASHKEDLQIQLRWVF